MKEIILSKGHFAFVDDDDFEKVNQLNWSAHKIQESIYAEAYITVNGRGVNTFMHWIIMGRKWIDHIDGNGLNNQKNNLRFCTNQQNGMNRKPNKNAASKYKGVRKHRCGKFYACIRFNGKDTFLGLFTDEISAAKKYDFKAKELFGEFARVNVYE